MDKGWIKIHRGILEWEWYQSPNVMAVFLHCILKANFIEKKWQGIIIEKGEFVTSYKNISDEMSGKHGTFSVRQVRTALDKLKLTGELTIKKTNKYSLIKINNYSHYQSNDKQHGKQMTNKRQTNDKQMTTTKERKECKNEKKLHIDSLLENEQAQKEYGNPEINKMLIALKDKIGISAFVDSAIERNMAKHCVGLLEKIGKDEFVRRLDFLLSDTFHQKNCNKIKYVYNNIKGFIEPNVPLKTLVL